MEIFFYRSDMKMPSDKLYDAQISPDRQILLISNHQTFLDTFGSLRDRIIGEGIGETIQDKKVFVPVDVKEIFLTWLKEKYTDVKFQKKQTLSGFKPSKVTAEEELFFQQMVVEEEWEVEVIIQQPKVPSTVTSQPEDSEQVFAQASLDASKYVSFPFAAIAVVSLLFSVMSLGTVEDLQKKQNPIKIDHLIESASFEQEIGNKQRQADFCKEARDTAKEEKIGDWDKKSVCSDETVTPSTNSTTAEPPSWQEQLTRIKVAIENEWYITKYDKETKLPTENGSALEYIKKIWNEHSQNSKAIEDISKQLNNIIVELATKQKIGAKEKCSILRKIYEFVCGKHELNEIKTQIDNEIKTQINSAKNTNCKLSCKE